MPSRKLAFFPDYRHENPYQSLLYGHLDPARLRAIPYGEGLRFSSGDVFHLHWEDIIYRDCQSTDHFHEIAQTFLEQISRLKAAGVRFFWTIHNFGNHEGRFSGVEQEFRKVLADVADRIFVLNKCHVDQITFAERPLSDFRSNTVVTPHGPYHNTYRQYDRASAKRVLGIEGFSALLFGRNRGHKGFNEVFKEVSVRKLGLYFCFVGTGMPQSREKKIHTISRRLSDDEVAVALSSCDCGIINFERVLNSGSFLLFLSFGVPCFVPKNVAPYLPLPNNYEEFLFCDVKELINNIWILSKIGIDSQLFQRDLETYFEENSWEVAARRILEAADVA